MPKWSCMDCDWWEATEPTDDPKFYCPECGGMTTSKVNPETIADTKTKTDKL